MNINGNKHFAEQYEGVKLNRWLCICYLRSKLTEYYANARASAASKHRTGVASYAVFSFANKGASSSSLVFPGITFLVRQLPQQHLLPSGFRGRFHLIC